jgi:DNA-binding Xre family transcriptional regulator
MANTDLDGLMRAILSLLENDGKVLGVALTSLRPLCSKQGCMAYCDRRLAAVT